jgi:porin
MMIPDQSTLGISVKHIFSNNSYGIVSISDATADSTKPFDNLFKDGNLFWSLEYGLVESPEKFYSKNIHFTYWKMDGGTQYGNKASSGINFSWMYEIEKWLPFVRAGMSSGDASLLSSNITLGAGYLGFSDSLFGVAVGLGETNKAIFGQSEYQFNAEIFYKTDLFNLFTLTPSIHYLDPLPLNPEHDQSWVFGLRIKGIF